MHIVVGEAHFQVKMYKAVQPRTKHLSLGALLEVQIDKAHAAVARFRSHNVQSTSFSEHFLKLGCGFAWQAQGILHPAKSEQNVRVL